MKNDLGSESSARLVIVISGPIASGKSTLAVAVVKEFERASTTAVVLDLDLIYELLDRSGAPKNDAVMWGRARRMAAALTDALIEDGIDVVVAEGDFLGACTKRVHVEATYECPDTVLDANRCLGYRPHSRRAGPNARRFARPRLPDTPLRGAEGDP